MISGIDGTIVATALPSIVHDLGGVSGIAWVVSAYLLFQVATMPLYGKIGDVYGRKRVLLFAIGLFVLGSVACGLAQSMPMLLAARAVQGIGGGGLPVLGMAILGDLVPPRQLGRWLGYQGMLFAGPSSSARCSAGSSSTTSVGAGRSSSTSPSRSSPSPSSSRGLHLPFRRIEHAIDYLGSALLTVALGRAGRARDRGGNDVDWVSPASGASPAPVRGVRRRVRVAPTPRGRAVRAAAPVPEPGVADRGAGQLHVRAPLLPRACSSSRSSSRRWPGSTPPSRASC